MGNWTDRVRGEPEPEPYVKRRDYLTGLILGPKSAGKTTLYKLLMREFDVHRDPTPDAVYRLLQRALERLLLYMMGEERKILSSSGEQPAVSTPGLAQINFGKKYLDHGESRTEKERGIIADELERLWSILKIEWPGPPWGGNIDWRNAPYLMERVKPILRDPPDAYYVTDLEYSLVLGSTRGEHEVKLQIESPELEPFQLKLIDRESGLWDASEISLVFFVVNLASHMRVGESLQLYRDCARRVSGTLVVLFNHYDIFSSLVQMYPETTREKFPNYKGDHNDPASLLQHIQQLYYSVIPNNNNKKKKKEVFFLVTTLVPTPRVSSPLLMNPRSPPLAKHTVNLPHVVDLPLSTTVQATTYLPDVIVHIICEYAQRTNLFSQEIKRSLSAIARSKLSRV